MSLFDRITFKREQALKDAKNYVSKLIKADDLWIVQYRDSLELDDVISNETKPLKYKYARRERAKLLAKTALRLMGYVENDINTVITEEKIKNIGKAEDMLNFGLKELGFGKPN